MVKINLLPYHDQRRADSSTRKLIIAASVIAGFIILIGSVHLYLIYDVSSLEEKLKAENERLAALTKIAGEINQVKIDKKVIEKKLEIIKTLEENRLKPVILMDELTTTVPSNQLWLTNFVATGGSLKIEGVARDNVSIARFMKSLEKTTSLSSVDLVASKQTIIAESKLQAFTLSCGLKYQSHPQAAEAAKAPEKGTGKK